VVGAVAGSVDDAGVGSPGTVWACESAEAERTVARRNRIGV
jgi:hypothetical protein